MNKNIKRIHVIDSHTGGEPTCVVIGGWNQKRSAEEILSQPEVSLKFFLPGA